MSTPLYHIECQGFSGVLYALKPYAMVVLDIDPTTLRQVPYPPPVDVVVLQELDGEERLQVEALFLRGARRIKDGSG